MAELFIDINVETLPGPILETQASASCLVMEILHPLWAGVIDRNLVFLYFTLLRHIIYVVINGPAITCAAPPALGIVAKSTNSIPSADSRLNNAE